MNFTQLWLPSPTNAQAGGAVADRQGGIAVGAVDANTSRGARQPLAARLLRWPACPREAGQGRADRRDAQADGGRLDRRQAAAHLVALTTSGDDRLSPSGRSPRPTDAEPSPGRTARVKAAAAVGGGASAPALTRGGRSGPKPDFPLHKRYGIYGVTPTLTRSAKVRESPSRAPFYMTLPFSRISILIRRCCLRQSECEIELTVDLAWHSDDSAQRLPGEGHAGVDTTVTVEIYMGGRSFSTFSAIHLCPS